MDKKAKKRGIIDIYGLELLRNWKFWAIFVGVLIFVFTLPYAIVNIYISKSTDYSSTGPIGDTIGGITAPIVNLISALLVFLAFRAQIQANEIVRKQLRSERKRRDEDINDAILRRRYDIMTKELNNLYYTDNLNRLHTGIESIQPGLIQLANFFHDESSLESQKYIKELNDIITMLKAIHSDLYNKKVSVEERLFTVTEFLRVLGKIVDEYSLALDSIRNQAVCKDCKKKHSIPKKLHENFQSLVKEIETKIKEEG
jgi:hypothetical protein